MKLVKEDISILKPKDPKKIVQELIDNGSINDKYAVLVQIFEEDYNKIYSEFLDRGIDAEEMIDTFISFWSGKRGDSPEKVHWILSDILQDNVDKVTEEMIKKAIGE